MNAEQYFIAPTFFEAHRAGEGVFSSYQDAGVPGALGYIASDLENQIIKYGVFGAAVYFPTTTQLTRLPSLISGRLTLSQSLRIYGGHLLPIPSLLGLLGSGLHDIYKSRGGRDAKPVSPPVAPGRRPRPIKPSRPTSSGQTSKPFWSSGKPKCKKGYRYDFRRKLCVKIR